MKILFVLLTFVCLGASCLTAAEPAAFLLRSPLDYQVFQRTSRTEGAVALAGESRDGSSLAVRVDGGPWQPVAVDKAGAFSMNAPSKAGGWFKVELRRTIGGKELPLVAVEHVGVGEVFIVAGQSNATNYGDKRQQTATKRVSSFDGHRWTLANDPQRGADGNGGSFMPAFGDALVARYDVPVAVAACGVGATSVRQWLPKGTAMTNQPTINAFVKKVGPGKWEATGDLFENMMTRAAALGSHGFRAILWHQGESDAGQARGGYPADRQISGKQYTDFMTQLITASRVTAKWDIPWLVAQTTFHSTKDAADEEFRAAQKALWDAGIAQPGPDTDKLGARYRAGVHFNALGLQTHGKLWAEKVGSFIDRELKESKP